MGQTVPNVADEADVALEEKRAAFAAAAIPVGDSATKVPTSRAELVIFGRAFSPLDLLVGAVGAVAVVAVGFHLVRK